MHTLRQAITRNVLHTDMQAIEMNDAHTGITGITDHWLTSDLS